MTRPCDAYRCKTSVGPGRFLCTSHWRMVPLATQTAINARYWACRKGFAFLSDVQYLQACIDAIRGIAKTEGYELGTAVGEVSAYDRLLAIAKKKAGQ